MAGYSASKGGLALLYAMRKTILGTERSWFDPRPAFSLSPVFFFISTSY